MLDELQIYNFKSLKEVRFRPSKISFFCGPNAAGKSNLAEAIDFLSRTMRDGVSVAVGHLGGFYNICYRKMRRTRAPIVFSVASSDEVTIGPGHTYHVDANISFGIRAKSEAIRADFEVDSEHYQLVYTSTDSERSRHTYTIRREGDRYVATLDVAQERDQDSIERYYFPNKAMLETLDRFFKPTPTSLLLPTLLSGTFFPAFTTLPTLHGIRVFQLNPRVASQPGTPSVATELGRRGENLGAVIDYLIENNPETFETLQRWLRDVVPGMISLKTDYTEGRKLGLYLREKGFGSDWYADDLSDGTIISIALFIALLDKRYRTILIEEPENSLHPWMLRRFLDRVREVSEEKQVLITTHSPLVVAASSPDELFLMERKDGRTTIIPAIERDENLSEIVRRNFLDLGSYWLSGGVGAVPEPPEEDEWDLFKDE